MPGRRFGPFCFQREPVLDETGGFLTSAEIFLRRVVLRHPKFYPVVL